MARHLGTEHTELYVTAEEAQAVIPHLPELYDEPFADSSQIPTHLLARMAREHVTVSLSGDGGDELFGGYKRYIWGSRIWDHVKLLPITPRSAAARTVIGVSPQHWDRLEKLMRPFLPCQLRTRNLGDRLHKFAAIFDAPSSDRLYRRLLSPVQDSASVAIGASESITWADRQLDEVNRSDFTERMMFHDLVG